MIASTILISLHVIFHICMSVKLEILILKYNLIIQTKTSCIKIVWFYNLKDNNTIIMRIYMYTCTNKYIFPKIMIIRIMMAIIMSLLSNHIRM